MRGMAVFRVELQRLHSIGVSLRVEVMDSFV